MICFGALGGFLVGLLWDVSLGLVFDRNVRVLVTLFLVCLGAGLISCFVLEMH